MLFESGIPFKNAHWRIKSFFFYSHDVTNGPNILIHLIR